MDALLTLEDWLRDDAGHPLGRGMPTGAPLRRDGDSHREGWMRIVRSDPCSYCTGDGGTVDHVEPQASRARGVHSWANYVGACARCNQSKGSEPMLLWLARRPVGSVAPVAARR